MRSGPDSKALYCPNTMCKQYGLTYKRPSFELERVLGAWAKVVCDPDMPEDEWRLVASDH